MKKTHSRKLTLNRETLVPLTDDALDQIHGGQSSLSSHPKTPPSLGLCRTDDSGFKSVRPSMGCKA